MVDRIPGTARQPRSRFRAIVAYVAIMTVGIALLVAWGFRIRATFDTRRPADMDARYVEMIVGVWANFHHGERTMTVRPDGTATMVIELTGFKARLFTPRLELDMVWSVEDGCMNRRNVGGSPPAKVDFVNRTYGDRVAEPILELTADRMVLQDQESNREYEWQRVE